MQLALRAQFWAINKHKETNHLYDGKPYEHHLFMVYDIAQMFSHYIGDGDHETVYAGCWLHDTIEDCRVTYNDVKAEFDELVAEIVYALSNEKGKTRKERANDKYYEGIRNTPYAGFIKLCDRAANIKHSRTTGSSMLQKYRDEQQHFQLSLDNYGKYPALYEYIESLLKQP